MQNLLTTHKILNTAYNPEEGTFWRIKKDGEGFKVLHRVLPNGDGMLTRLALQQACGITMLTNRKAEHVAWEIANGEVPSGSRVIRTELSYKISALFLLNKDEYQAVKDAEYNYKNTRLTYYANKYRVVYKSNGKIVYDTFDDPKSAEEFKSMLEKVSRDTAKLLVVQ